LPALDANAKKIVRGELNSAGTILKTSELSSAQAGRVLKTGFGELSSGRNDSEDAVR
jgi:hypothetical protein